MWAIALSWLGLAITLTWVGEDAIALLFVAMRTIISACAGVGDHFDLFEVGEMRSLLVCQEGDYVIGITDSTATKSSNPQNS
jgi:hypothetical protein